MDGKPTPQIIVQLFYYNNFNMREKTSDHKNGVLLTVTTVCFETEKKRLLYHRHSDTVTDQ